MARPAKSLDAHVREGTFRARRDTHRQLLTGPPLQWPALASLQARYQQTRSEPERRAIALEVEQFVRHAQAELARRAAAAGVSGPTHPLVGQLDAELAELGKPGSVTQLLEFFPYYLRHPKGRLIGEPFQLAAWQKRFLREFYRRDTKGRRVYRTGILGVSRGSGKTPLAAALGLYELVSRRDAPEVYCAAASKEQAGIALGFARSFVEQGPLNDWLQLKSGLYCPANSGWMQVVSADGRLAHGRAPSVAIVDELWALETEREEQTYQAFASALHKRDDAYLLGITTAGYDKQSLLGRIYEQALNWPDVQVLHDGYLIVARDLENGLLLWWHGAPAGAAIDDPKVWRKANPASWIRTDDLKRQLADPGLDEGEFRRLNLNQWTASNRAWLPEGCWDALLCDEQIPDRAEVYVGVDVGIYHDSTAVCWAHVTSEGRILLRCHVWSPREGASAHEYCDNGVVSLAAVEDFIIRRLKKKFRIRELAYDPHFFQRSAEILERDKITMIEFLQASGPMADAYQGFYQLAREGRLAHNGDPVLAAHINATSAYKTARGWKLSKLNSKASIDATVACVLAVARAQHHKARVKPNVVWFDPYE
jgi:phage terminase large subunit-like protein